MNIKICIVHYNTPKLTECLIRSINKFVPESTIYIFDNSDKLPFTYKQDNIVYIDNTEGKIIDFDAWIKSIPESKGSAGAHNKWASAKHCYTIQKCIEMIAEPFILLDSDVLLKRDITELVNDSILYAGEWQKQMGKSKIKRVLPYCLYINTDLLKKYDVTFYKKEFCHGLNKGVEGDNYDTGAWFYTATENLPHKEIKYSDYVVHFGRGSWRNKPDAEKNFLNTNKKLWQDNVSEPQPKVEKIIAEKKVTPKYNINKLSSKIRHSYQKRKLYNFIYG